MTDSPSELCFNRAEFHRLSYTQSKRGSYVNSQQIFIFPCQELLQGKNNLPTGGYIFGIPFLIRQMQSANPRLLNFELKQT